jgi:hypothetical protein
MSFWGCIRVAFAKRFRAIAHDDLRPQLALNEKLEGRSLLAGHRIESRYGAAWAQGVAGSNPVAPTTFRVHRSHIGHRGISRAQRRLEVTGPPTNARLCRSVGSAKSRQFKRRGNSGVTAQTASRASRWDRSAVRDHGPHRRLRHAASGLSQATSTCHNDFGTETIRFVQSQKRPSPNQQSVTSRAWSR